MKKPIKVKKLEFLNKKAIKIKNSKKGKLIIFSNRSL